MTLIFNILKTLIIYLWQTLSWSVLHIYVTLPIFALYGSFSYLWINLGKRTKRTPTERRKIFTLKIFLLLFAFLLPILGISYFVLYPEDLILASIIVYIFDLTFPAFAIAFILRLPPKNRHQDVSINTDYVIATKPRITITAKQLTEHIKVIASTGAGKTKSVLSPLLVQAIHKGQPVIVIDPKGDDEVIQVMVSELRKQGRISDLLYFDIAKSKVSKTYNPLINGTPSQVAARVLATMATSGGKYAFFEEKQKEFMRAVMKALADTIMLIKQVGDNRGKAINFMDLYSTVAYVPDSIEYLYNSLASNKSLKNRAMQIHQIWLKGILHESYKNKRFAEYISGLRQHLGKYAFGLENAWLINDYQPEINLMDATKTGKVVYFSLRALDYPEAESLDIGKMVLMDLQAVAAWRQREVVKTDIPILVLIDEAPQVVPEAFLTTMEMARSAGIAIVLIHQANEQFPKSISTRIDQNTNTKIIMRINEPKTAKYYADAIGQERSFFKMESEAGQHPLRVFKDLLFPRWSQTEREQYDYIIRPEVFMRLNTGEGVVILKGGKPMIAKLPFYSEVPKGNIDQIVPKATKKGIDIKKGLNFNQYISDFIEKKRQKNANQEGDKISEEVV